MSAASFILAINLFVAVLFSTCFAFISSYSRSALGTGWLALAFSLVAAHAGLEFLQPHVASSEPLGFAVFVTFLCAMMATIVGLSRHYAMRAPLWPLVVLALAALPVYMILIGLPRGTTVRPLLYQTPFMLVQLLGAYVILRSHRRGPIDKALLAIFCLSALQFAGKILLGAAIGFGHSTQSFLGSLYGAYSQTLEAILLVSTGLLLLLATGWDLLAEITARSETDKLSGLLNRRGFEDRAERAIGIAAHSGQPATMIVADLDHFKHINDTFGHAIGDRVIATFASVLASDASQHAIIGRLGGEEFGMFLPGGVADGRAFAENARGAFADLAIDGINPYEPVTASFGVTEFQRGDSLSDLLSRADAALYDAKRGGRNRVRVAHNLSVVTQDDDIEDANIRRRGSRRPCA